jgi:hypothetical protein
MAVATEHAVLVEEIATKVIDNLGLEAQLQSKASEASSQGSKVLGTLRKHQEEVTKTLGGAIDRCLKSQAAFHAEHLRIMGCVEALLSTLCPNWQCDNSWPDDATKAYDTKGYDTKEYDTKDYNPGYVGDADLVADESLSAEEATFTVTLRKADGASLGLKISCDDSANALLVESVLPGGAVEAWNRQCTGDLHRFFAGGPGPQRAVIPGDRIIEVNGISGDPPRLSSECASKRLLKIKVQRGGSQKLGTS